MLFDTPLPPALEGLILTPREAVRQQAARRREWRLAGRAAARLLAAARQAVGNSR